MLGLYPCLPILANINYKFDFSGPFLVYTFIVLLLAIIHSIALSTNTSVIVFISIGVGFSIYTSSSIATVLQLSLATALL